MTAITTKPLLILGSASPRRLELLQQIGYVPDSVISADIDETPFKKELPSQYALRLAVEKANVLATQRSNEDLILAADTVVACGRRILPKAENSQQVAKCLQLLSGRRHRVYTAICIQYKEQVRTRLVMTVVAFKRLSEEDVADYVSSQEGKGKAGGYAIQGLAAGFIPFINGSYSNVVGLPLYETRSLLVGMGLKPAQE